jgi:hypothetical protein
MRSDETITTIKTNIFSAGGTGTVKIQLIQREYNGTTETEIATGTSTAGTSEVLTVNCNHKLVADKTYLIALTTAAMNATTYIYTPIASVTH